MGLQTVELVMDVEDEFGIHFADADVQEILTVGQLFDLTLSSIRAEGSSALKARHDLEAFVWKHLCEACAALASGAMKIQPLHIG